MRWKLLLIAAVLGLAAHAYAQESMYRSPYAVEFTLPKSEIVGDLERTERGDTRLEAEIPHEHWYSRRTLERWQGWGLPPRDYPEPPRFDGWSLARKRERVIAVALRFRGGTATSITTSRTEARLENGPGKKPAPVKTEKALIAAT
jgi:hypothetical protein